MSNKVERNVGDDRAQIVVDYLERRISRDEYEEKTKALPATFTIEDLFEISRPERGLILESISELGQKIANLNKEAALADCDALIRIGVGFDRIKKRLNL